jgi:IMP dehydrogenase
MKVLDGGITFDDVYLVPQYSELMPSESDTRTRLSRNIDLNIPLVSAPMDTVTESALAIALAQEGGLGFIHRNLTIEEQVREVDTVKRSANGVIEDPVTLRPDETVAQAIEIMNTNRISGLPILEGDGLVGILTRRDLKFQSDTSVEIRDVMTHPPLVTAPPETTLAQAEAILQKNKVEKLLLVDDAMHLRGLITNKDIDRTHQFPNACRDARGRLRVGAAIGPLDDERLEQLIANDVDVVCIDTAHGHSKNVVEAVRRFKQAHDVELVAGNVATADGARDLVDAGADAVKVGIGPGSICTTRIVAGVGVPQITAITEAASAAGDVPVIADGGVRYSGDIIKALAAGAGSVMLGSLFAGLTESAGDIIYYQGRSYKVYRGMGSLGAMVKGTKGGRYDHTGADRPRKMVPEGVEGRVPHRGPLADFVYQLVGGLRAGMGYVGARAVAEIRERAVFIPVSPAGVVEGHPHDIAITQEAPNYQVEDQETQP